MNLYKKVQRRTERVARLGATAIDNACLDEMRLSMFLSKFDLHENSSDKRTKGGKLRRDLEKIFYKYKDIIT
jgi:hypothetical protein